MLLKLKGAAENLVQSPPRGKRKKKKKRIIFNSWRKQLKRSIKRRHKIANSHARENPTATALPMPRTPEAVLTLLPLCPLGRDVASVAPLGGVAMIQQLLVLLGDMFSSYLKKKKEREREDSERF